MITRIRKRVHDLLDIGQGDDLLSRIIDFGLIGLITLNVLAIIVESIDSIASSYRPHFDMFELVSVAIFPDE